MLGNQFNIPKAYAAVQSAVFNIKNAKAKFTKTVVRVKKRLGPACFHYLYLNLKAVRLLLKSRKMLCRLPISTIGGMRK